LFIILFQSYKKGDGLSMTKTKKLFAFLMAALLALPLYCTTALAADPPTHTFVVEKDLGTHTEWASRTNKDAANNPSYYDYKLFQMFTGTITTINNKKVLGNVEWGASVPATTQEYMYGFCELDGTSAFELNENGARNAALAAKLCGARLIALSTGYVFSGEPPRQPWAWGEGDIPRPRTVYGMSKFAGEQMIQMIYPENSVILRTDWLYGARGRDFVHMMAELGRRPGEALKVADDRRGNPTSAAVVADVVRFLITRPDVSGIVHATCEDQCTRYELARELFSLLGADRGLIPCASAEFPYPAPRPANCALKKSVLNVLGYRTPNWRDALRDFVAEEFF
jgi:dTDP-4-dehydrorhamnose reductase